MEKIKKGDVVKWQFGDESQYKVVATKDEPHITASGDTIEVEEGSDFIIAKTPLEDGKYGGFQHVPMQHLEFII